MNIRCCGLVVAGEGMSEILEDERIVRCVTSEILFLSYLATSRGSAVGSLAAEASLRAESLELALSGFHSLLTERTASLAAADRARQRGLQLFMEEQRQQLTRTWERLQRRRQMEDIIWDGSGEGVQAEVTSLPPVFHSPTPNRTKSYLQSCTDILH
jgi:hypothetical protein